MKEENRWSQQRQALWPLGWEAQVYEEKLIGLHGEAMKIAARDTFKRELFKAEDEALRLYRQTPYKPNRLARIAMKATDISRYMNQWSSGRTKGLPESFLNLGEELVAIYRNTLRHDCPATVNALRILHNKWIALRKMANSWKALGKVLMHIKHIINKWRKANSQEKDRLHQLLQRKLAYMVKQHKKFYDSAKAFSRHADTFLMNGIAADISKTLIDNRIQLMTWHHELKITIPELSSDVSSPGSHVSCSSLIANMEQIYDDVKL